MRKEPLPFILAKDGLRLKIRLTPKGDRNAILGLKATEDGGVEIAACVTAPPEDGRANKALIKLLAKTLKLPAGRIEIASGATDRHKQVLLPGDAAALEPRIKGWAASLKPPK